jgi:Mn-dependent DtxR family transcriptional regulator
LEHTKLGLAEFFALGYEGHQVDDDGERWRHQISQQ